MTDNRQQEPSPWAAPGQGDDSIEIVVPPTPQTTTGTYGSMGHHSTIGVSRGPAIGGTTRSSDTTSLGAASPADTPPPALDDRRLLMRFVAVAGSVVAAALVVTVVLTVTGVWRPFDGPVGPRDTDPVPDTRPPLAKACPPPTDAQDPDLTPAPPPPPGPRTVDEAAGISYRAYGEPWTEWREDWRGGTLGVHYRVGQHFITETYHKGTYHASILSGSVPAAINDGTALDLKCAGRLVTADVRTQYYPQPNEMRMIRDGAETLGGRPAWVSVFRLHFREPGLTADNELVAVATINVGRPEAAILYVSIPGTHKQWDWVVDDVLKSVRPT